MKLMKLSLHESIQFGSVFTTWSSRTSWKVHKPKPKLSRCGRIPCMTPDGDSHLWLARGTVSIRRVVCDHFVSKRGHFKDECDHFHHIKLLEWISCPLRPIMKMTTTTTSLLPNQPEKRQLTPMYRSLCYSSLTFQYCYHISPFRFNIVGGSGRHLRTNVCYWNGDPHHLFP